MADAKRYYNVLDYLRFKGVSVQHGEVGAWQPVSCPWHADEHASASVNPSLNRFRCHACDVGGDILDVVGHGEDLDTRGAIEWLMKNLPRRF